jgi:hypothetical protein
VAPVLGVSRRYEQVAVQPATVGAELAALNER